MFMTLAVYWGGRLEPLLKIFTDCKTIVVVGLVYSVVPLLIVPLECKVERVWKFNIP